MTYSSVWDNDDIKQQIKDLKRGLEIIDKEENKANASGDSGWGRLYDKLFGGELGEKLNRCLEPFGKGNFPYYDPGMTYRDDCWAYTRAWSNIAQDIIDTHE